MAHEKSYEAGAKGLTAAKETKEKPKHHKLHEIAVRKGAKGGFIAKHTHRDAEGMAHPHQPEFPLSDMKALREHMDEHMGDEAQEAAEGNEPAGGDAQQA